MVHAPHTSDRARPAGTASETNASLCRYASCRFIVASGLAESRGGLVAASLAVVAAGKPCRCGADSAEASEECEARRTNRSMLLGGSRVEPSVKKSCDRSTSTQPSLPFPDVTGGGDSAGLLAVPGEPLVGALQNSLQ
eukprot:scaffold64487_cov70-Phaeocystis_antarctica.AAC.1